MAAAIVREGVRSTEEHAGGLFGGQKLWFSANVPQRKRFIEDAEANGAVVVPLEKQADVLIVDHIRKNPAPGTHSYRYIELTIRNDKLEDLAAHVVGPAHRSDRQVGSVSVAPKSGRTAFSEEDDQLLYNWVQPYEEQGGYSKGNVIFVDLERIAPHHTYQSWRDRWLKKVKFQSRKITKDLRAQVIAAEVKRLSIAQAKANSRGSRVPPSRETNVPQRMPVPVVEISLQRPVSPLPKASFTSARSQPVRSPGRPAGAVSRCIDQPPPRQDPSEQRVEVKPAQEQQSRSEDQPSEEPHSTKEARREQPRPEQAPPRPSVSANTARIEQPPLSQARPERSVSATSRHRRENHPEEHPTEQHVRAKSAQGEQRAIEEHPPEERPQSIPHESALFTRAEFRMLLTSAKAIISLNEVQVERSWSRMAHAYPSHSAEQWKQFFSLTVRPAFEKREQRKEAERQKREENARENDDAVSVVTVSDTSLDRMWTTTDQNPSPVVFVDQGSRTSRPLTPEVADSQKQKMADSPTQRPLSPTSTRPPEPNEARKRSFTRGTNSQESNGNLSQVDRQFPSQAPVSQPDDSSQPQMHHEQPRPNKRRKVSHEDYDLEIPSTPEHRPLAPEPEEDESRHSEDGSPIPQTERLLRQQLGGFGSPDLWSHEDDFHTPRSARTRREEYTSPLAVRLVSDGLEIPPSSSHEHEDSHDENDEYESEIEIVETAPDLSHMWETAPKSPGQHQRDNTTRQPEHPPSAHQRIDAQALYQQDPPDEDTDAKHDLFTLPSPPTEPDEAVHSTNNNSPDPPPSHCSADESDSDDDSDIASLDSWVDAQLARHPGWDELLLLRAVQATTLKRTLVLDLYHLLSSGSKGGTEQVEIPEDIKGVWTKKDDAALRGGDAREIERVEVKHGRRGVERRWEFLEKYP